MFEYQSIKLIFYVIFVLICLISDTFSRPLDYSILRGNCGLARDNPRLFIPFRKSCYHIPRPSMDWYSGLRHCLLHDLTLATLDEESKIVAITEHCAKNYLRQEYWIGGTNLGRASEFWYIGNGQNAKFFKQNVLKPKGQQRLCLKLNIHFDSTHFASESCDAYHPVICERRM